MFRRISIPLLLVLFVFSLGCAKGCGKKADEAPESAADEEVVEEVVEEGEVVEEAAPVSNVTDEDRQKGNVVTGETITEQYAGVLCAKYGECQVEGAPSGPDCVPTIAKALTQSEDWNGNEFKKDKMDQCMADLKALSCDDFKAQKVPESCEQS